MSLPSLQACRDFLDLAETHSRKWQRALQYEREQRIRLEETIEQLAKQHNSLERACRGAPGLSASSTGITSTAKGEHQRDWGCPRGFLPGCSHWVSRDGSKVQDSALYVIFFLMDLVIP